MTVRTFFISAVLVTFILSGFLSTGFTGDSGPVPDPPGQPIPIWESLEPGLDLGRFQAPVKSGTGDSIIRVLRIDPERFIFTLLCVSAGDSGTPITTGAWADAHGLTAAINPSMYQKDYRASVSLMKKKNHINNPIVSKDKSVFVCEPREKGLPVVDLLDRECDDFDGLKEKYRTQVQSIRMISCRDRNVWEQQTRKTSTTAIARDTRGRILFIHVRSGYSTHDLIEYLRMLPLNIDRAMYTEGGSEAQLSIRSGKSRYDFTGSYESILDPDSGDGVRGIPNVLGIKRR